MTEAEARARCEELNREGAGWRPVERSPGDWVVARVPAAERSPLKPEVEPPPRAPHPEPPRNQPNPYWG